jgi:hypothetical protein
LQIRIERQQAKQISASPKHITLHLHNLPSAPKQVMQDAESLVFDWDSTSKILTTQLRGNSKSSNLIRVKW